MNWFRFFRCHQCGHRKLSGGILPVGWAAYFRPYPKALRLLCRRCEEKRT